MRRRHADRRGGTRFEVVGDLWGTMETVLRLPLRNIGANGALLESSVPLPVNSVHRIAWTIEDGDAWAQVRVRHVTGVAGGRSYLIGVEFISADPIDADRLQRWVSQHPTRAKHPGTQP